VFEGLGVTLDLLKNRAEDVLIASLHAYRRVPPYLQQISTKF
jgi:hypothetical protein